MFLLEKVIRFPFMMEETTNILQFLKDHTSEVTTCDISNSNLLVTGAGDKTVRVWEWVAGEGFQPTQYSPLPAHKYGVTCVRFSPQGTMIASSSVDGTTVLWNSRSGSRIHTLVQATRCSVRRLEFTPDSGTIITAGDDGIFCVWDLLHGSLVRSHRLHNEEDACVQGLTISSDGQLMASADTGGLLQIWSLASDDLECLSFHRNVNDGIACCAFSPNRSLSVNEDFRVVYTLATSGCDGVVRLWSVTLTRDNKDVACDVIEVAALNGHNSDVHDLRFNSNGSFIATIGLDKCLRVWQVSDGECVQSFSGHSRYGNCCAFSKDSALLVSGSNDKTLIVWKAKDELSLHSNLSPPCTVSSHFSTEPTVEQEQLMAGRVEQLSAELQQIQILSTTASVNSVAFGGSRYLAVAGGEKLVKVWERCSESDEWELCQTFDLHKYSINQVAFSPCGSRLVSCSLDGVLIHCDLQTGLSFEMRNDECASGLRTCAISPTADVIATAGDDEKIFLWDAASLEFIKHYEGHRDAITDLGFSPDGFLLASTSIAGDVGLLDLRTCSMCLMKDNVHDLGALSCSFAYRDFLPAGNENCQYVLATCGNDSLVRIWHADVGALDEWVELSGHGGNVMMVRFSPVTPFLLASTATDNTARLWNAKSGECVLVIEHHVSMVNSCAFSQDSNLIATGSLDRTAVVWRLPGQFDPSELPAFRLTKRVQQWSAEDLGKWLQDLGHPSTAEKAIQSGLIGRQVLQMSEDEILDSFGIDDDETERANVAELLWWCKMAAQDTPEVGETVPHHFLCPITHDIMQDPVLCSDGFTYERAAITEWMLGGRFTSPMTNEPLTETSFVPNAILRKEIYKHLYGERPT